MSDINIGETITKEIEETLKKVGMTNILIAGKTGVGKSTLINQIFHGNLATTGQGKPCTQDTKRITKEGIPVSIFDTKGLEIKDYQNILEELRKFIQQTNNNTDENEHIHAAWICISEGSARVEDAEIDLVKMLLELGIPVIGVITKAINNNGFSAKVKQILPRGIKNVVRVHALEETIDGNIKIPQMGLENLVEITSEVIPEGRRNAFVAAQKASIKQKISRAHKIVATAAATAAASGATPIPFSDAVVLVPIQVGMFAGISTVFGLDLSKSFLGTLVSSSIGSTAATIGGKAIVSGLLKCIPGIGTLVGAAISGTTAALLTTTIGEAYIGTLAALFEANKGEPPTVEDISKKFTESLGQKKN